ncbi:DUF1365 domain-containing protein [Ectothiorhodospiraceae bacterium WFHF3C12]|nr:DUF1365 domain-containing protein [Ectothiorhodospiraceae bacterium WFHF3C12]
MHRRMDRVAYRFDYRVFSLLVDIDRLDELDGRLRLFSHNRRNLVAIHDRDHGPKDGTPLRPWVEDILARHGINSGAGRIELFCMPRVLGYAFNPLSLYYCRDADDRLVAVLCEVRNTFGEWHGYLLHDQGRALALPLRHRAAKVFHVSPFLPRSGEYRFRLKEPGERFSLGIRYLLNDRPVMVATQTGERRALRDAELGRAVLAMPLMTFKVMAAIHWQAARIWLRGGRFHHKPLPPTQEITE